MTFKIKLEDKAAFLNRMEKQGEAIGSEQIKDNKLEGYFEVEINNPKQLEIAKAILKQSPKINTLKEMANKLTKDALKEMVRQELHSSLLEKKKIKDEKKKEMMNEAGIFSPEFWIPAAAGLGVATTLLVALFKDLKNAKTPEEKAAAFKKAADSVQGAMGR